MRLKEVFNASVEDTKTSQQGTFYYKSALQCKRYLVICKVLCSRIGQVLDSTMVVLWPASFNFGPPVVILYHMLFLSAYHQKKADGLMLRVNIHKREV